ncbi:unnamed protein product [marine sediment metagenome]|uniref:CARDB domain-containing protein n=2 Tax=marine sediment metagenome TaxID=412755 RepID=X1F8D0_9ZZZZ
MVIVVRPGPYTAGPYALSIGVTPKTGSVGDAFRFLGILTLSGSPMMGITVQLVLEGVGNVGEDVTGSMGNYDITWTADRSGTLLFHAEAPGVGVVSDTISITVEEGVKKPTSLSLTASPASGAPPFYTTLMATLMSNVTPVGYREVEIYMRYAGIPWTKLTWGDTDSSGVKSFSIHIGVAPVEFYAYFAGDGEYEECASPIITITAEGEVFTSVMDFVVPDSLPAGSTVSVRVLAKNTGGGAGRLKVYVDGNPDEEDEDITVGTGTTPSDILPGNSVWFDITFSAYFNMPDWDYILTARNYDSTSQISKTISLGVAPPPEVSGDIIVVYYWIEGMAGWGNLEAYPTPAKVPVAVCPTLLSLSEAINSSFQ